MQNPRAAVSWLEKKEEEIHKFHLEQWQEDSEGLD